MFSKWGSREKFFRLSQSASRLLDYVFTPHCLGCQVEGEHWCASCNVSIQPILQSNCAICQGAVKQHALCKNCRNEPPYYDQVRSLGRYEGPLAKAIVKMKYRPNVPFGNILAHRLERLVRSEGWEVDMVLAMPQSRRSHLERGYNQVEMFSRPLARLLGVPHGKKQIRRQKNTRSQVGLSLEERSENVRDAFVAESHLVKGGHFLLIDDVTTSGASLNFASKALRAAGADKVSALCLAKADHRRHIV